MDHRHRSSFAALLLLFASLQAAVQGVVVEVFPRESVVSVGQNVSMLCRVSVPIQYCRVVVPGLEAPLNVNPSRGPTPPSNAVYLGDGLDKGHCGVSIPRVEDKYNGVFKCSVGTANEPHESQGTMAVIVARAPKGPPVLDLTRPHDPQDSYHDTEPFVATCIVPDARPVANITWMMGDDILMEGMSRPEVIENRAENLFTVRQNLTRAASWSDNGKELRCIAVHPLIPGASSANTARRRVHVKFSPKPQSTDIEQFGFIEGEEGIIIVRIKANPKPSFLWTVGRENIDEGGVDSTGHYEVQFAEPKEGSEWETKLRIRTVTKEDVEQEYRVQATNTIGQQDYVVRISTSSQPRAMAEMGAGAIVGIVIAVLLVLLIIFIVVFARATGRWCFAGGAASHRTGETSDTESADQGPGQKKNILKKKVKMPLTNMFKKAKDKVAGDTEVLKAAVIIDEKDAEKAAQQAAQDVEQGKECVYAELTHAQALERGRPVVVRPEDDKTEYAEIVHTKDEKKPDK